MSIVKKKTICGGSPRIKGTRLTVRGVLSALYVGKSVEDILKISHKNGIKITREDVKDAMRYPISNSNKCRIS